MIKEYYKVVLNNNNGRNPMKIDNIIYRGKFIDMPEELSDEYEGIEILGIKTLYGIKEAITGEPIIYSESGIENGLSYSRIVKANNEDLISIINKYRNMSIDDINRYKKAINDIKNKSIKLYNENNLNRLNRLEEEKSTFEFLKYIEEFGI